MNEDAIHLKYRPTSLDRVIGQEQAVTRIRGMLSTGKLPNAIAFFGPPSAGKTTLGRIVAAEFNGKPVEQQQDYREMNAATQKGIDDIRDLEKLSKFRAINKRRFILIDEAQQILSNAQAAQALLKPLEEPAKDTTWIICSMEPEKFGTTKLGQAIAGRCTQFVLEAPTEVQLMKQAIRIAKGEKMPYLLDEEKSLVRELARASNQNMRQLANLIQSAQQYYDGLEKKPKLLTADVLSKVISSASADDDKLAVAFMVGLYSKQYAQCIRCLLDVKDGFQFVKKTTWLAQFMINIDALEGQKHSKVWWSTNNRELLAQTKPLKLNRGQLAHVYAHLVRVQGQALTFGVPPTDLLGSEAYFIIQGMK